MTFRAPWSCVWIAFAVGCSDGTFSEAEEGSGGVNGGGVSADGGSGATAAPGAGAGGGSTGGSASSSGGSGLGSPAASGGATAGGTGPSSGGGGPGTGGSQPATGGSAPAGGSGGTSTQGAHHETHSEPGATGDEPNGMIPVCCTPSAEEQAQIDAVFELLNAYRVSRGLSALSTDLDLQAAIEGHCHHMAAHAFFSHDAPESVVRSFSARASACGARANGENIASGYRTTEEVMTGWKNSPGHDQNMLGARWTRVGIGNYEREWGQIFGQ